MSRLSSRLSLRQAVASGRSSAVDAGMAVVIVNYNGRDYLRQCLRALDAQSVRPRRVVVIDNASTDDSLAGVAQAFPEVEIVPAGGNLGFAAGNNRALPLVDDCEWVILLNADALPERDWLEQLACAADASPEVDFFGCKMLQADDPHKLDGTGDVYHVSGLAWRRDWGHASNAARDESAGTVGPCAAAAMYRRSVLEDVGGFDEDFFCYLEDVDLALRLRLAGYRYQHVPAAVVHHAGSVTVGRHSDFYLYHGHRNLSWVYVKNVPGILFWAFLPQHLLLNLVTFVLFALRGHGRVMWRAKRDALRGLPRMWRKRRVIQRARRISVAQAFAMYQRNWLAAYLRRWR